MLNELIIPVNDPILLISTPDQGDILRFDRNGDIYVRGNLIENDHEVVDGFRDFLKSRNLIK